MIICCCNIVCFVQYFVAYPYISFHKSLSGIESSRLQELEDQYRKEREEASNLLEQQRLVGKNSDQQKLELPLDSRFCLVQCSNKVNDQTHFMVPSRTMRVNWRPFRNK